MDSDSTEVDQCSEVKKSMECCSQETSDNICENSSTNNHVDSNHRNDSEDGIPKNVLDDEKTSLDEDELLKDDEDVNSTDKSSSNRPADDDSVSNESSQLAVNRSDIIDSFSEDKLLEDDAVVDKFSAVTSNDRVGDTNNQDEATEVEVMISNNIISNSLKNMVGMANVGDANVEKIVETISENEESSADADCSNDSCKKAEKHEPSSIVESFAKDNRDLGPTNVDKHKEVNSMNGNELQLTDDESSKNSRSLDKDINQKKESGGERGDEPQPISIEDESSGIVHLESPKDDETSLKEDESTSSFVQPMEIDDRNQSFQNEMTETQQEDTIYANSTEQSKHKSAVVSSSNNQPIDSIIIENKNGSTIDTAVFANEKSSQDTIISKDVTLQTSTEVLHIDENEEDADAHNGDNESDPFASEVDNAAVTVENGETISTCSLSVNSTEGDEEMRSSNESAVSKSKDTNVDDELVESIIPDTVGTNEPPKEIKVRKFDITPVRLEKLIDPSKLSTLRNEESESLISGRPQRLAAKKAGSQIKEIVAGSEKDSDQNTYQTCRCHRCNRIRMCRLVPKTRDYVCVESCYKFLDKKPRVLPTVRVIQTSKLASGTVSTSKSVPDSAQLLRKCGHCGQHNLPDEKSLSWEAMDFCSEDCMSRYQMQHGNCCSFCKNAVQSIAMGKYAVRFGLEARQFCSGVCLEEFKKGLKSCSYCQVDISKSTNTYMAAINDKQSTMQKGFCSLSCAEKYERMCSNTPSPAVIDRCTVCTHKKQIEIQVLVNDLTNSLCSDVCFRAFKFANGINDTDQCQICQVYFQGNSPDSHFIFHEDVPYHFCSKVCLNVFILFRRKIVPCSWCKVKKYNFDMIKKVQPNGGSIMMCSLNCLTLYSVSVNTSPARKIKCDFCSNVVLAQYHLTMSDATIRNFCSYNCVVSFQNRYNKSSLEHNKLNAVPLPVPLGCTSVHRPTASLTNGILSPSAGTMKVTNSLTLPSSSNTSPLITTTTSSAPVATQSTKYIQQIIVKPPTPKSVSNKILQCRPSMLTKSVSCKPISYPKETQTEDSLQYPPILPIPVPIYVPVPMHMYTTPFPVPVPFAVPIPVPIFIPTAQKTYKGVMARMKEILEKTPSNPFEADLLLMASIVADEEKLDRSEVTKNDSGDEDDDTHFEDAAPDLSDNETFPVNEDTVTNNLNEDILQSVLKMASDQLNTTSTVDLEAELTSNTITPQTQVEENSAPAEVSGIPVEKPRTRKRAIKSSGEPVVRKRTRQQHQQQQEQQSSSSLSDIANSSLSCSSRTNDLSSPPLQESERPDSSLCLKYTIGIRAWKQWVVMKNEQLEQAASTANKKAKTFNTNILKLTTDELNYLLCLFVKEVRKPNGMEYAPDTIYYLCLSIQQYLFENGRIDNIFSDALYEPFTNALDEVVKKFSDINDVTQYVVTRVEEEHLWESKQLGAHSPHVLLTTLMFFNTKYFNLATLEEHMQLSFSHIMKHWKRNPNSGTGKPGSPAPNRNVVLRFYPPQAALDAPNSRKKKVYEQHENETDPLRCPVKLYEFYMSKCPESVKQRNDVFYLQPERSCVPDSPVWYSTVPLQKELLMKMLHRVLMIKEVNIALLAS